MQYYDRSSKRYIWVSPENPLPVSDRAGALLTDTIAATGTAAELAEHQAVKWVVITNTGDAETGENLLVGNDTEQAYPILPGQSLRLEVTNLNLIYVKAESASASGAYIAGS